tara:strand:+ start:265 stop:663 length:399 start_codon:yes stop_codon:yes gene_type:complete
MDKKSIFKTFVILFIGVAIGILAGGRLTMHKIHRANEMRTERGFIHEVSRLLNLNETQMDTVMPILQDFAVQNRLRHDSIRIQERRAHVELRKNLSSFLSEKELKQLRRLFRPRGPQKHNRKNHPSRKQTRL